MLTHAPQSPAILDTVNRNGCSGVCELRKEDEPVDVEADKSGAPSSEDIRSWRFGSVAVKSLGQTLAALVPRMGRIKLSGYSRRDIASRPLHVRSGPPASRDSVSRLNAALHKWSVECEQPLSSAKPVAAT